MVETFFGEWSVRVDKVNAHLAQRFIITGSDSDGIYPGVPGTSLPRVSGVQWTLAMEWNDSDAGLGWQPSNVRRSAAGTVQEGLVVRLGADDKTTYVDRDLDYDDLVLVCVCLDPTVNPFPPGPPPFDFTIPEDVLTDAPKQKPPVPKQEPNAPRQESKPDVPVQEPDAPRQNATT